MTDQERYRTARKAGPLVVIEGFHALKHAIRFGARIVDIVTDDRAGLAGLAHRLAPDLDAQLARSRMRTISTALFESLSPMAHPTRVLALAERPVVDVDAAFRGGSGNIVVLDDPRHAGNIGASVRVAAAAGAAGLFVTGTSDPWHPAAVRGGAGLQFALPVARITELPSTERVVIGLDADGDDIGSLPADSILVFGSERDGIGDDLRRRITRRVRIPMRPGVSSLNLATAVAIMLYRNV